MTRRNRDEVYSYLELRFLDKIEREAYIDMLRELLELCGLAQNERTAVQDMFILQFSNDLVKGIFAWDEIIEYTTSDGYEIELCYMDLRIRLTKGLVFYGILLEGVKMYYAMPRPRCLDDFLRDVRRLQLNVVLDLTKYRNKYGE